MTRLADARRGNRIAERARRWQAEARRFFDGYNAKAEKDGLLLGEHRQF